MQVSLRGASPVRPGRRRRRRPGQKAGKAGGTAVAKKPLAKSKPKRDDSDKSPKKKKPNIILFVGIGLAVLTIGVLGAYFGGVFDGDDQPSNSGEWQRQRIRRKN